MEREFRRGGKVRLWALRQNCGSNFSRLARQRKLPAVAARLFFYLTRIYSGGKQVLGNEMSVKKLVALLEATTGATRRGKLRQQF